MNFLNRYSLLFATLAILIAVAGCSERDTSTLPVSQGDTNPLVWADVVDPNVYWQPFSETNFYTLLVDSVFAYGGQASDGARSLKFNIAPQGSALGLYAGGVITSAGARNLTGYNALTFYARATFPIALDLAGFGNDNTGTSKYEAGRSVALTEEWTYVVVPIPDSSKLLSERGLLTFAEATKDAHPEGYDIWIDEIRFANVSNIEVFRTSMVSANQQYFLGSTVSISGTSTVFRLDGAFIPVSHMPGYFDYASSDESVVAIEGSAIRVKSTGTATITASLGETAALGAIAVTGYEAPTVASILPTVPAADVVSLWGTVYPNILVDTWRADFGGVTTKVEDFVVADRTTKMYSSLNYVAIDFQSSLINASELTHLHLDVYTPEGTEFIISLVSFPVPGTQAQTLDLVVNATSTPAFVPSEWSSLEIPLADFVLPETGWDWAYVGQMVLSSGDTKLVLVDNLYFHK
ncbi:MAG: hypothetical protein ACI9JE_001223 [Candidatus Krumholzibacteriia bacterium]